MTSPYDLDKGRTLARIVYALQGAALAIGVTYPVGALISHLQLAKAAGTWLESHFRWQIFTFWVSLVIGAIGALTLGVGALGLMILSADLMWIVYRIVQGWVRLNRGNPVGAPSA